MFVFASVMYRLIYESEGRIEKVYRENRDVLEVITGQRSTLRSNAATPTRTSPKKCSFSLYRKLFVPTYFVKCRQTLLELNSYGPHSGSERDKF